MRQTRYNVGPNLPAERTDAMVVRTELDAQLLARTLSVPLTVIVTPADGPDQIMVADLAKRPFVLISLDADAADSKASRKWFSARTTEGYPSTAMETPTPFFPGTTPESGSAWRGVTTSLHFRELLMLKLQILLTLSNEANRGKFARLAGLALARPRREGLQKFLPRRHLRRWLALLRRGLPRQAADREDRNMSDATDNRLDPCELLAGIEARLIHLAVLITKQGKNQATETNPTGTPDGNHQQELTP